MTDAELVILTSQSKTFLYFNVGTFYVFVMII